MLSRFPPIAMLHYVSDSSTMDSLKPYNIGRTSFLKLLDYLENHNYSTITFSDIVENDIPKGKKIILTFDDCARELFEFAIPELVKRKFRAVFFISTAHIGGSNEWDNQRGLTKIDLMNENDLLRLSEFGMEVGSHAHNHIRLKEQPVSEVAMELKKSKRILEEITGKRILSFAYPFGSAPNMCNQLLKESGYSFGCSIFHPNVSRFALRRFIYHDEDTKQTISQKLSLAYQIYRTITDPFKSY